MGIVTQANFAAWIHGIDRSSTHAVHESESEHGMFIHIQLKIGQSRRSVRQCISRRSCIWGGKSLRGDHVREAWHAPSTPFILRTPLAVQLPERSLCDILLDSRGYTRLAEIQPSNKTVCGPEPSTHSVKYPATKAPLATNSSVDDGYIGRRCARPTFRTLMPLALGLSAEMGPAQTVEVRRGGLLRRKLCTQRRGTFCRATHPP